MTRRTKLWLALASVFILINAGGAVMAAANGEGGHTLLHLVLLLPGAYIVRRLASRAGPQDAPVVDAVDDHLAQLEQSVDAIALEVERIGEAQRFMVKLQQERAEKES